MHRRMSEHAQVVSCVKFETGARRTAKEGKVREAHECRKGKAMEMERKGQVLEIFKR